MTAVDFFIFPSETMSMGVMIRQQSSSRSVWIHVANFDGITTKLTRNAERFDCQLVQAMQSTLENADWDGIYAELQSPPKKDLSDVRRQATQRRWDKHAAKVGANSEFSERMKICQRRLKMKDAGIQCDMESSSNLVASWMEAHLPSNTATLFINCVSNIGKGSPRYTREIWDIAMSIYLSSPKTYKILKQLIRIPSVSCLYEHYSESISLTKRRLIDDSNIRESLLPVQQLIETLKASGTEINTQFTLAIDAFSFRTFTGSTMSPFIPRKSSEDQGTTCRTRQYSNGFLMLLIPHDYRIPAKLIHLALAETGAYNTEINEKAMTIMRTANAMGIRIWFRATDGDPGVANSHNDFYDEHVQGKTANYGELITSVWTWLCGDCQAFVPVSDPLHIFKNIRARFISHPISIFRKCAPTNIESVRAILNLGPALNDNSQLGKMRDNYVVSLFTLANVSRLIKAKEYTNAFLIFPFACWMVVLFSDQVSLQLRLFFCELSFQLISAYADAFDDLREDGVTQQKSPESPGITFAKSHYAKRILNTLCGFGVALVFGSDSFRIDRIGTHLVENAIGIARSTSADPR